MSQVMEGLGRDWVERVAVIDGGSFADDLVASGHQVEQVGGAGHSGALRAILALRRLIQRAKPDLIHANGFRSAVITVAANAGLQTPVVWFKPDFARDGWPALLLASRCRHVIGMSHAVMEVFGPRYGDRVTGVPAGVPDLGADRIGARARVRELLGGDGDGRVVTLSGRLCPGKGQHELLAIAPELAATRPDVRILLLGGEDTYFHGYGQTLRRQAGDLLRTGVVTFLDHRDDARQIVAGSDVLVMPSVTQQRGGWKEGFGLVAAEAMWVGTPVVAYANGALPEVIGDCGLIVPEGDQTALTRALLRVLDDDALRCRMTECGQGRARAHFRLERAVEMMRERYLAAFEGRAAGGAVAHQTGARGRR